MDGPPPRHPVLQFLHEILSYNMPAIHVDDFGMHGSLVETECYIVAGRLVDRLTVTQRSLAFSQKHQNQDWPRNLAARFLRHHHPGTAIKCWVGCVA